MYKNPGQLSIKICIFVEHGNGQKYIVIKPIKNFLQNRLRLRRIN
jgi:hypothetical protein